MGKKGCGEGFSFCAEADVGKTASIASGNGVPSMGKEGCGEGLSFCVEADCVHRFGEWCAQQGQGGVWQGFSWTKGRSCVAFDLI